MSALDWPGLESLEFDAPQRAFGRKGDAPAQRPGATVLDALPPPPSIRERLHVICALYAHTRSPEQRTAVLERMEALALEVAHGMAMDLLANGWKPD